MKDDITYDLAVVGGGLAGIALSIQIARQGYKVVLFEKERYPFHRVCGEYISLESWDFLQSLGIDLEKLNTAHIKRLRVSDINGKSFELQLPLGGFGISRYKLDYTLFQIAKESGVEICEQTRINEIQFLNDEFKITSPDRSFKAKMTAACFGKRSNLDVKWKRPFILARKNKLNNYIGIKYHIRYNFPNDLIALHNFKKGYCGISKVEDDQYCLCYLTNADNLQNNNNDINKLEEIILSANPHLKEVFSESEKIHEPVIISQISFDRKNSIEDHVLMIGDATGMITPLCGNGMSMALHASKIAAEQINKFLGGYISRKQLEKNYTNNWRKLFAHRLRMGRILQRLFDSHWFMSIMIKLGRSFPSLIKILIKQTHGQPF
ncbi:MAG TPA: NAD(P)/FAD-dependent oxidoreductase [Chitinophagaceae bacterium]|nr:NAD(P)/FAD-dependent oxidoreductase [Chitinophagaceae bacterium]